MSENLYKLYRLKNIWSCCTASLQLIQPSSIPHPSIIQPSSLHLVERFYSGNFQTWFRSFLPVPLQIFSKSSESGADVGTRPDPPEPASSPQQNSEVGSVNPSGTAGAERAAAMPSFRLAEESVGIFSRSRAAAGGERRSQGLLLREAEEKQRSQGSGGRGVEAPPEPSASRVSLKLTGLEGN